MVGAVATVVVGAGIVMLSTREATMPALREPALERAAGQAAPPAGAPVPLSAQPSAGMADKAPPPAAPTRAVPRAIRPKAEPLAAARDEAQEVAVPTEQEAVTSPAVRAEAPPAPTAMTTNETARAQEAKSAVTSGDAKYGEGAGVTLQRTRQSLGVAKGEPADEFSGQPTFTSLHGKNARRLTSLAEAMDRAPAWDSAAEEWAMLLLGTAGTPLETETRFQLARARYRAWQAGITREAHGAGRERVHGLPGDGAGGSAAGQREGVAAAGGEVASPTAGSRRSPGACGTGSAR